MTTTTATVAMTMAATVTIMLVAKAAVLDIAHPLLTRANQKEVQGVQQAMKPRLEVAVQRAQGNVLLCLRSL